MRHITHLYNKQRDLQIKCARRSQHPRTDMMDMVALRYQQGQGMGNGYECPIGSVCVFLNVRQL